MTHMKAVVGKRYRHYKGGEYTVLAIGRLEASPQEQAVVYRSEYDDPEFPRGTVWIRPLESFEETILVEGKETNRFVLMEHP